MSARAVRGGGQGGGRGGGGKRRRRRGRVGAEGARRRKRGRRKGGGADRVGCFQARYGCRLKRETTEVSYVVAVLDTVLGETNRHSVHGEFG